MIRDTGADGLPRWKSAKNRKGDDGTCRVSRSTLRYCLGAFQSIPQRTYIDSLPLNVCRKQSAVNQVESDFRQSSRLQQSKSES